MRDEQMDEILRSEPELVPSSGFVSAVMERVREEAVAPAPIPFPWTRALPGCVVAAGVFGWTAVEFARSIEPGSMRMPTLHVAAFTTGPMEQAGWVVAAFAISIASWLLTRRLAR